MVYTVDDGIITDVAVAAILGAAVLLGGCTYLAFKRMKKFDTKKSKKGPSKIPPKRMEEARDVSESEDSSEWDTETDSELELEDDVSISSEHMHAATTPLPEHSSVPGSVQD